MNAENNAYLEDYTSYNYSIDTLNKGQVDRLTTSYLKDLHNNYPNDFLITSHLGSMYLVQNDPKQANFYFQLALHQRIYLVRDTAFMVQYGRALHLAHKDQEAEQVLKVAMTNPDSKSYQPEIKKVLKTIQKVSK